MKKISLFLCVFLLFTMISIPAYAYDNMDNESESNNTMSTADYITSERLMKGSFTSTSDPDDYFKAYISAYNTINIQLSGISGGCDYDLWLYDPNGNVITSSRNGSDVGEWISHYTTSPGYYYIRVQRWSGTSSAEYKLYMQSSGQTFNHSFYAEYPNSSSYMRYLGRDHTNNISGIVFLQFGQPKNSGSTQGVLGYDNNFISYSNITTAVNSFITGYNENPRHTNNIQIVVGISNKAGQLPSYYWDDNGQSFKQCISNIQTSGRVTAIYGGIDAEMDWNSPYYTKLLFDGYRNYGTNKRLYHYGDHIGQTTDFGSGDPSWPASGYVWKASDVNDLAFTNGSYCIPQIYNTYHSLRWTYQKKWGKDHGTNANFAGVMSTNKWFEGSSVLLSNQQSYNYFYNDLANTTDKYGNTLRQSLGTRTWISYPSQYK